MGYYFFVSWMKTKDIFWALLLVNIIIKLFYHLITWILGYFDMKNYLIVSCLYKIYQIKVRNVNTEG
jgi:hypothetical protein